jgi:hypothetical protein
MESQKAAQSGIAPRSKNESIFGLQISSPFSRRCFETYRKKQRWMGSYRLNQKDWNA